MKAGEISELIRYHDWLVNNAARYIWLRKRLCDNIDKIYISKVMFVLDSDKEESFEFNSHRTIKATPFIDAIDETIDGMRQEINDIETELSFIEFERKIIE